MVDASVESCIPPGFRFHPTDEELVGYYLRKKVVSQKIDLDVIKEIDLYRIEPWDLQEKCRIGYEEQNEWYFYSHKDKKYPSGTRTNRATVAGFWKATGRDKAVYDHRKAKLIGMRKTLVFYKGRAPHGRKTDWIIHEYRLQSDDDNGPPKEEGWVVCRAFKKRITCQTKTNNKAWDSSSTYYDDHNHHNENSRLLAQSSDHTTMSSMMIKGPVNSSMQMQTLDYYNSKIPGEDDQYVISSTINAEKAITDWRDLDRFVASQLMSYGKDEDHRMFEDVGNVFGLNNFDIGKDHSATDSDFGLLLLLQGGL